MITRLPSSTDDILEFEFSGAVTDEDYKTVLIPAIDEAIEKSDTVRLLVILASGLKDFTFGAMLQDARTGMKHWRGFDRAAVVTGSKGMANAIRAFSVFMPCPVKTFGEGEADEARRWLRESLGAIHQTDLGDGVLHVQLVGQLDSKAYEGEAEDMNAFIRKNEKFRLLLDLREFDGWQGLGGIGQHLKLVRDHARLIDKAAILGTAGWQELAVNVGKRVIGREARHFGGDKMEEAVAWLKS